MIKNGDYVVSGGHLGVVLRPGRIGRAEGWVVQDYSSDYGTSTSPHFRQGHLVEPALVGKNVCRKPLLCCFCGLAHAPDEVLPFLDCADSRIEHCSMCSGTGWITGWITGRRIGCVSCKGTGRVEVYI